MEYKMLIINECTKDEYTDVMTPLSHSYITQMYYFGSEYCDRKDDEKKKHQQKWTIKSAITQNTHGAT